MVFYTRTTGERPSMPANSVRIRMTRHLSVTELLAPSARRGLPPCRPAPLTTILTSYDLSTAAGATNSRRTCTRLRTRHHAFTHLPLRQHTCWHTHTHNLSHVQVRINSNISSPNLYLHHPCGLHHRSTCSPWTELMLLRCHHFHGRHITAFRLDMTSHAYHISARML
jgi:hypothetical protein